MTIFKTVEIEISDSQGRTGRHTVTLQSDVSTLAGVQDAVDDLLPLFAAVSGAGIQGASVSIPLTVTPVAADPDSNKDEGAVLQIVATDGGSLAYRLPMPKKTDGIFNYISGGKVTITDTDLLAYLANFKVAGDFAFGRYSGRLAAASPLKGGYLETH